MDWFTKIKQRYKGRHILFILLGNSLSLLLGLYGLKCIVTLHGKFPEPPDIGTPHMMRSFNLASIKGMAAVMAGLGYISGALFTYLSGGSPPSEDYPRFWRFLRGFIRWGSLLAMWG